MSKNTRDESTVTADSPGPLLEIGEPDWLLLARPLGAADTTGNWVYREVIELAEAHRAGEV